MVISAISLKAMRGEAEAPSLPELVRMEEDCRHACRQAVLPEVRASPGQWLFFYPRNPLFIRVTLPSRSESVVPDAFELLHSLAKAHVLHLPHELDDVAFRVASEAVKQAFCVVDRKARVVIVVPGTEPGIRAVMRCFRELHAVAFEERDDRMLDV